MKPRYIHFLMLLALFVSTGASCPRSRQVINDPAPIVLQPQASLEEVIRVVNTNSAGIRQVQSAGATLSIAGMPRLDATYAFERPKRFRMRAETNLLGPQVDMGSNDTDYWMWVKYSEEPGVYYGRHDYFDQSAARQMLPVPPDWLIEALGVVELDPTGRHDGPRTVRPGQLEIRSFVPSTAGMITRIMVVDDTRGWILEQHLFDNAQRPLASAMASGFEYDPNSGASLPRVVEVHLPTAQLNFTLETERHLINQLQGDPNQLWSLPQINGVPLVNLDRLPALQGSSPTLMARRPQRYARQDSPPPSDERSPRRLPQPQVFNNLRLR